MIEDGDAVRDPGIYVMAGDDTDPPTHYSYVATLHALNERLVVCAIIRRSGASYCSNTRGDETATRMSEDGGRTWGVIDSAPPLDAWELIDQIDV